MPQKARMSDAMLESELRTMFAMLDKDHDGRLCADDIVSTLRSHGFTVSDRSIAKFIKSGNGRPLEEDEFIEWVVETSGQNSSTDLKQAFRALDKDCDGYLTRSEFKNGLKLLGYNYSDRIIILMIKEADKDGDGKISLRDFLHIMKKC